MSVYEYKTKLSDMKGETLISISGMEKGSEEIRFECASGRRFTMWYEHDCCASCDIEDVCGDPQDLIGLPLLMSEDVSNDTPEPDYSPTEYNDSHTWTFVKFATEKGYVTLRWYGSSNGYYSESPTFKEIG